MHRAALATIAVTLSPTLVMARSTPVITTVAGGGPNGVPALSVGLSLNDLVADGSGNIYFPSTFDHKLFRIDPAGMVRVLAGTGIQASLGDGGPISRASFLLPTVLTLAPDGSPLVFEGVTFEECCTPAPVPGITSLKIRRLDLGSGAVQHVAGGGYYGFQAAPQPAASAWMGAPSDILASPDGTIHIGEWYTWSDPFSSCFWNRATVHGIDPAATVVSHVAGNHAECPGPVGDGSLATQVSLHGLPSLALHASGDLLVSHVEQGRVRRIDRATGIISTYAGNGSAGSSGDGGPALEAGVIPGRISTDAAGNLFICEGSRVRRVDSTTGIITTVAGNGTLGTSGDGGHATEAQINCSSLAADPAGTLYIDGGEGFSLGRRQIRRVDAATGIIQTIAGDPTADYFGDGGPAAQARFRNPADVEVAPNGDLIIADASHLSIRKVDALTGVVTSLQRGSFSLGVRLGLALHPGGAIYFVERSTPDEISGYRGGDYIFKLDPATGEVTRVAGLGFPSGVGDGGPAEEAGIYRATDLDFDASGNLFIAETGGHRIRRIDAATGIITTYAGGGGTELGDGGPATQAALIAPGGVAIDPDGNTLIADTGHHRIRRVDAATGLITTVSGNGTAGFSGDGGSALEASIIADRVGVDAAGNIYISGGHRVRRVDAATGIIQTIAGDGTLGFYGDGGHPNLAALGGPLGLDVDGAGNVYVAAYEAGRVRRITQNLPAEMSLTATPSLLWPPGHHMRDVHVTVTPGFGFSPVEVVLESIESNEQDDAPGGSDGRTTEDIQDADIGQADFDFRLRAERDSSHEGRIYTIIYRASDEEGDVARATATVVVPHNLGGKTEPLELSARETPSGTLLEWLEVPGARSYDAIRGDLSSLREIAAAIDLGAVICVEGGSEDPSTLGFEDAAVPEPGSGFFYLVDYDDGQRTGFGTESSALPLVPSSGGCG